MDERFNLLTENWLPVLRHNGVVERVGVVRALTEATKIRDIAASNPMDRLALIRFLLALLYWCKGGPPEGYGDAAGDFPEGWFRRAEERRDCFNLFGPGPRFLQRRLASDDGRAGRLPATYLIHEVPTGTNKWHFRHATDMADGLCPACCAMGLLRLPLFATSGGQGKPPGINAKPPVYALCIGSSLGATLRHLWCHVEDVGVPFWEQPDMMLPQEGRIPLLTGLTWVPRRVWLDAPAAPVTACMSCGRKEPLVRRCIFAGVGSMKTEEDAAPRDWRDPHVIYETDRKGRMLSVHASDALGAGDAAAGQWSKLLAAVLRAQEGVRAVERQAATGGRGTPAERIWLVGFSTVQNDKYLEALEFNFPFSSSAEESAATLQRLDRWRKEVGLVSRRIRPPTKKADREEPVEIRAVLSNVRPHVERRVSGTVPELAGGGDEAWVRAARLYAPMMRVAAVALAPGLTAAAAERRYAIGRTLPDMSGGEQNAGERKKGGRK